VAVLSFWFHGKKIARKAVGVEYALSTRCQVTIASQKIELYGAKIRIKKKDFSMENRHKIRFCLVFDSPKDLTAIHHHLYLQCNKL